MTKKKSHTSARQGKLFEFGEARVVEPGVKRPRHPVWTENKAKLIERYLKFFVYITHHGAYIDGFAGPQEPKKPDTWAAKLVLESEPRRLQKFFFVEILKKKVAMLRKLVDAQPAPSRAKKEAKRRADIFHGDVNVQLPRLLDTSPIRPKEAAFCLLDQRTFECHWQTVERVARYKSAPHMKIEIFYFMPNSWLDRAISGLKDKETLRLWWGRDDWQQVRKAKGAARADLFVERFKNELGYASVKPWPIYERASGGKVMYFMIHATDHPEAPALMARAYSQAVLSDKEFEQLVLPTIDRATQKR